MGIFLLNRTISAAVTIFLIVLLVFVGARVGGDPISVMFPDGIDPDTQAALELSLIHI